jgi:uncharacterized membrane protein
MYNVMGALYLFFGMLKTGIKDFFVREYTRIRDDESGMEMLQIILIIVIVVIIAAVLWTFLGDWIQDMFDEIFNRSRTIDEFDLTIPER